jgi:hypothetical protein
VPALPPVANVIHVRLIGSLGNATWNNIFHLQYSGQPPNSAALQTLAGSIATAWIANLGPLAPTVCTLTGATLTDLTSPTSASTAVTLNSVGTRAGTPFSAQVAVVGSWAVNLRRRGGHWRNYWTFGVVADLLNQTQWTPAFAAACQSGLAGFRTALNAMNVGGSPVTLVGVSWFDAHALRPTPLVLPIQGVSVHPRVDTQRRRLGKEHA